MKHDSVVELVKKVKESYYREAVNVSFISGNV